MDTQIKTTAYTGKTPEQVYQAKKEALTQSKTQGITSLGIKFRKLANTLILF